MIHKYINQSLGIAEKVHWRRNGFFHTVHLSTGKQQSHIPRNGCNTILVSTVLPLSSPSSSHPSVHPGQVGSETQSFITLYAVCVCVRAGSGYTWVSKGLPSLGSLLIKHPYCVFIEQLRTWTVEANGLKSSSVSSVIASPRDS